MNVNNSSIPAKILLYSTAAVILTIGMREIAPILTTIFFLDLRRTDFYPICPLAQAKKGPRCIEHPYSNSFIRFHCRDSRGSSCQSSNPVWKPDPELSNSINCVRGQFCKTYSFIRRFFRAINCSRYRDDHDFSHGEHR